MQIPVLFVISSAVDTGVRWFQTDHIISCCSGFPFHKIWKIFHIKLNFQSKLQVWIYCQHPSLFILCLLHIMDKNILRFVLFRLIHAVISVLMSLGSFIPWSYFFCWDVELHCRCQEWISQIDVIEKHQWFVSVSLILNFIDYLDGFASGNRLNGTAENHIFSKKFRLSHSS